MLIMKCMNCGFDLHSQDGFCGRCGSRAGESWVGGKRFKMRWWHLAALGILISGAITLTLFFTLPGAAAKRQSLTIPATLLSSDSNGSIEGLASSPGTMDTAMEPENGDSGTPADSGEMNPPAIVETSPTPIEFSTTEPSEPVAALPATPTPPDRSVVLW